MNNETKFTPGPWESVPHSTTGDCWIRIKTDKKCNSLDVATTGHEGYFRKADADLIAAAPELYECVNAR